MTLSELSFLAMYTKFLAMAGIFMLPFFYLYFEVSLSGGTAEQQAI